MLIGDFRGGRNGIDSPIDAGVSPNQCHEAMNVDWSDGALARRRGGATALSLAGGTAPTTAINSLSRFVPSGDESLAEMFMVDSVPIMKHLAGGVAWADVTLDDPMTGRPQDVAFATLNGKFVISYLSGVVDRMHVYDPGLAVPRVRRSGINPGLFAATVANAGGGAYAAVLRYYRVRFIQVTAGVVVRRSEPTTSVSFTPSGAGTVARITRPAAPGEGETHWEVDGSVDNLNWNKVVNFEAATHVAIATTTYDDSTAPSGYASLAIADEIGYYTTLPSAEYIVGDGNRLIMAGRFANSLNTSRVWYTPVLGSSDKGDDERLVINNRLKTFVDLNEKDGGKVNGLSESIAGTVFAFKYRRIWRLSPTGLSDTPFQPREISHVIGTIDAKTIVTAEDANGSPAVYFLSYKGPYRITASGLEYLGRDIEDQWRGLNGKTAVNLGATTKVGHGRYYADLGQIWWWVATGASNTPNLKLVLDVRQAGLTQGLFTHQDRFGTRGGWSIHDGPSASAICSVMFSNTVGASMSRDWRPYIGLAGPAVWKCDTGNDDAGTTFQAYVKSRSIVPAAGIGTLFTAGESMLTAKAQAATTIRQTYIRDFGVDSSYAEVDISARKTEDRVMRKFGGAMSSEIGVVQVQLGDPQAVSVAPWSLDSLNIPMVSDGDA